MDAQETVITMPNDCWLLVTAFSLPNAVHLMNFTHLIIQSICIDHCFKHKETVAWGVTRLAYRVTLPTGGGAEIQTQGCLLGCLTQEEQGG